MASRLYRLIKIIRIIRRKRYPNVQDLCEETQVKERTLFSDIRELKEYLGIDVQYDRFRGGYYIGNDDLELNFMSLTNEAAFLLLAAFELLSLHGSEELVSPLRELFDDEINLCLSNLSNENGSPNSPVKASDERAPHLERIPDKDLFIALCMACSQARKVKAILSNGNNKGKDKGRLKGKETQTGDFDGNGDGQNDLTEIRMTPRNIVYSPMSWKIAYQDDSEPDEVKHLSLSQILRIEHEDELEDS
ncbi:MAG: hypothetical protein K2X27_24250 [Candidatus Obscuribacterales bacterium]|nr:hypothetical protein [Candidatus Obscuribacterales bacterium]